MKIAMLSKWHVHAEDYAKRAKAYGALISHVWDEIPERGEKWAADLGCKFVADLDELLTEDFDAVINDTPTTMHREVLVKAANAKKHIFTEKALAPTVAECNEIAEAIERNGVKFLISFPMRTQPHVLFTKKAIEDGLLGQVTSLRIRNGHTGASDNWLPDYWYDEKQAAGGAMMDLGCHPMYTAGYLLGKPLRIGSMYNTTTNRAVEDNAANVIEFINGTIAVIETSLTTYRTPECFEVYGTKGTLILDKGVLKICSQQLSQINGDFVEVTQLPKPLGGTLEIFLDGLTKGTDLPFTIKDGINLTELLENAYIAHKTGKTINIE